LPPAEASVVGARESEPAGPDPRFLAALLEGRLGASESQPPRPASPAADRAGICISNLRQSADALRGYVMDYNDTFPPTDAPVTGTLRPYLPSGDVLLCPADATPPSYAVDARLGGARAESIARPRTTVMLFESDDGRAPAWRHGGAGYLAFVDGHVQRATRARQGGPSSESSGPTALGATLDASHSYGPSSDLLELPTTRTLEGRRRLVVLTLERASWAYQLDTGRVPKSASDLTAGAGPPGYRGPYLRSVPVDPVTGAALELRDGQVSEPTP